MSPTTSKPKVYFLVSYRDPKEDKPITLKVSHIEDSNLGLSFVRMSGFVFDESQWVVDPEEERLKTRFENIKSLHISIYSILSVTEVGAENFGLHFKKDKSKLLVLPSDGPNVKS